MSSQAPTKRNRTPNTLASGEGIVSWLGSILSSTVGSKILVALTGLALTGFVIVHLIGNLQIFVSPDAINNYAKFLKGLGPILWIFRIGLLALFLLHIVLVIRLKRRSYIARPVPYKFPATIQASAASRSMLLSGMVVGSFVLFHLAHFTFGWVSQVEAVNLNATAAGQSRMVMTNYLNIEDQQGRHDVYSMVVAGFRNPVIAVIYIFAQLLLFLHLSHGVSSALQSLGLNNPRFQRFFKFLGFLIAALVVAGNLAIVIAVWTGMVPPITTFTRAPVPAG